MYNESTNNMEVSDFVKGILKFMVAIALAAASTVLVKSGKGDLNKNQ
jgi:hypothetical protein